jgi:hypothetical protein
VRVRCVWLLWAELLHLGSTLCSIPWHALGISKNWTKHIKGQAPLHYILRMRSASRRVGKCVVHARGQCLESILGSRMLPRMPCFAYLLRYPEVRALLGSLPTSRSVAYLGDNEGYGDVIDLRAGKSIRPGFVMHSKCVAACSLGFSTCTVYGIACFWSFCGCRNSHHSTSASSCISSHLALTRLSPCYACYALLCFSHRRVNSLHLEPLSRTLLASSGTDGMVRVWDIRKLSAPLTSGVRV